MKQSKAEPKRCGDVLISDVTCTRPAGHGGTHWSKELNSEAYWNRNSPAPDAGAKVDMPTDEDKMEHWDHLKAPAPAEGAEQFHATWMRANIRRLIEKNPSEIEIEFAGAYAASLREQLRREKSDHQADKENSAIELGEALGKLKYANEQLAQANQKIARQVVTIGERQESWHAMKEQLAQAQRELEKWKREWAIYRNAWLRELGGTLLNKHHEIDAFVLTTRQMKVKADKWQAHENGMALRDPFWMVDDPEALARTSEEGK